MLNLIKNVFGCHSHEWGKWTTYKVPYIKKFIDIDNRRTMTIQERTCNLCGKKKMKKVYVSP